MYGCFFAEVMNTFSGTSTAEGDLNVVLSSLNKLFSITNNTIDF